MILTAFAAFGYLANRQTGYHTLDVLRQQARLQYAQTANALMANAKRAIGNMRRMRKPRNHEIEYDSSDQAEPGRSGMRHQYNTRTSAHVRSLEITSQAVSLRTRNRCRGRCKEAQLSLGGHCLWEMCRLGLCAGRHRCAMSEPTVAIEVTNTRVGAITGMLRTGEVCWKAVEP